jgi:protein arginine N-methyltransferase 1
MSCLGRSTLVEPIVDIVDPNDIVTNVCSFYQLDMNTCTDADIEFANTYKLTMLKEGRVDAFVVWFDVGFNKGLAFK